MEEFFAELTRRLIGAFTFDFARYLMAAGSVFLVVWGLLKKPLAGRKIRTRTPHLRQMVREFAHSMKTVIVYAFVGMLTFYGKDAGLMTIYGDISDYGMMYYAGSIVLMILAHDTYFYWVHWLMHRPGAMKYIHALHHRSMNPTPWTAYSFDVFEAATHALFVPLFLLFVPMHSGSIVIFLMHMIFRNAIGHCGYELFPRRWATHPVFGAITLVTHHDLHHANGKYNMGLYFTWWDRIMGTEHPEYLARATGDPTATRRPLWPLGKKAAA